MNVVARIEELSLWAEELTADATSGHALLVLLCAVAAVFGGIVRGRGAISSYDRQRVRTMAKAAMATGVSEAALVDGVRRLTGEAVRRAPGLPALADASHVVLADCLAATGSPRLSTVRRLLQSERTGMCTVVVFRIQERRRAVVIGALAELDGPEVFAGSVDDNAVVLAPRGEGARVVGELQELLGTSLCAATADSGSFVAGYQEAAKVLDLALAAERDPGLYHLDDFLIEYAAMCDPAVSARLMNIVRPLLSCDRLYETLKAFVRCGHNRARTARELFIHRTTMDYRIRRIEEITGYDPAGSRGSQVLAAAVTLFSLRGALSSR
jgi:hypothetical protein